MHDHDEENGNEHVCDECGDCTYDKSEVIYIDDIDTTLCLDCASNFLGGET